MRSGASDSPTRPAAVSRVLLSNSSGPCATFLVRRSDPVSSENPSPLPAQTVPPPLRVLPHLRKAATGISGLDEVTGGGLPAGRPTLVCGPAGCGKTLLAMEFLIRGITEFDEPGLFVAFEESIRRAGRERRIPRVRSPAAAGRTPPGDGSRPARARRLVGDRRVGPKRTVHPARCGDRRSRRQAGGPGHRRNTVRRVREHRDPSRRAASAVQLAQGKRGDGGGHR